jgi:UDPglucose--hexose-1-phosphate uridylyltransferase
MILPIFHMSRLIDLDENQKNDLSEIIHFLTIKYDNLFQCSFSYSMGIK